MVVCEKLMETKQLASFEASYLVLFFLLCLGCLAATATTGLFLNANGIRQFFPRSKFHNLLLSNLNFLAGLRIPASAGRPRRYRERAKADKGNALVVCQGLGYGIQGRFYNFFGFNLGEACSFGDIVDEFCFVHSCSPGGFRMIWNMDPTYMTKRRCKCKLEDNLRLFDDSAKINELWPLHPDSILLGNKDAEKSNLFFRQKDHYHKSRATCHAG